MTGAIILSLATIGTEWAHRLAPVNDASAQEVLFLPGVVAMRAMVQALQAGLAP